MAENRDERLAILPKDTAKPALAVVPVNEGHADLIHAIEMLKRNHVTKVSTALAILFMLATMGLVADAIRRQVVCGTDEKCNSLKLPEIFIAATAFILTGICFITACCRRRSDDHHDRYAALVTADYDFLRRVANQYHLPYDEHSMRKNQIALERKALELGLVVGKQILPFFGSEPAIVTITRVRDLEVGASVPTP